MEENQTMVTEFILLGFCLGQRIHVLLFGIFSLFYAFTLLGNGAILALICLDPRLHTPMYFFLSHLAIVDIAYACNTVIISHFSDCPCCRITLIPCSHIYT
uniref:G-protein coupled receptors family 1 profile domain-containing protein n=1 Tax=Urocitellus parryii TaxID=9999 RepID=A0A8D2KPF6_UROPR